MAISLVSTGAITSGGGTSIQIPLGAATTAGNLLVMWASGQWSAQGLIAINQGWSMAVEDRTTNGCVAVFYKPNCGASETAPTISWASGSGAITGASCLEFSGAVASSPLDDQASSAGASSPQTATAAAPDGQVGNLTLACVCETESKAGTTTMGLTLANSSTTALGDNGAVSTTPHYIAVYGITTSNATADSATGSSTSMNLATLATAIASFIPFIAPLPEGFGEPRMVEQAVNRGAVFCLGKKWGRKGRLWIPAADRPVAPA